MNVKIVRKSKGMESARSMCIRCGYFTEGTDDDYEEFLNEFSSCEVLTDDDVIRIATICFMKTDLLLFMRQTGESAHGVFNMIAFSILNDCTFEVLEDA